MSTRIPYPPNSLPLQVAQYERVMIVQAFISSKGSRIIAARRLLVTYKYLMRRVKILGIDLRVFPEQKPGRPKKSASRK